MDSEIVDCNVERQLTDPPAIVKTFYEKEYILIVESKKICWVDGVVDFSNRCETNKATYKKTLA